MNFKQITGLVVIIIGAIALIISFYAKSRVDEVKKNIQQGESGYFPNNPLDRQISEALEKKVSAYDTPILIGIIGGIVLVVVGAGTMMCCRRR